MKKQRLNKFVFIILAGGLAILFLSFSGIFKPTKNVVDTSTVHPTVDTSKNPTLTVDMLQKTGPLKHGSSGFLYGLGEDGVPTTNTLTALKPKIAVQKAPDGMQHPNGDALKVAETFIESGGEQVQIYMQDFYAIWPYEFTNIDDYIKIVKEMVPKVKASKYADKMVYVPFNEPDWIWYKGIDSKESVQNTFFGDWLKVYTAIKEIDPNARIAGTGCSVYQAEFYEKFIPFCKANNCMPDIITWHELQEDKLSSFANDYDNYRNIETANGLSKHEIVINEYAPQSDCSVPGRLVNWISTFEDKKVSACLPYWHISNNLNDLAADNNEVNGAWWLYKWYGDMSGETLKLTQSNTTRDGLYGLASLDDNKKSANVIFGGINNQSKIVLNNIDKTKAFIDADKVNIKVDATYWTAYHGVAPEPTTILKGTYAVKNGSVAIDLNGMDATAAYNITVTQADKEDSTEETYVGPWRQTYEAEDATFIGGATYKKSNASYAYSNGKQVGDIYSANDGIKFNVIVPKDGYYKFDMIYGNGTGNDTEDPTKNNPLNVKQSLSIDGGTALSMILQNTLSRDMEGMHSEYISLKAGKHELILKYLSGEGGASVDCIYLTYTGIKLPVFEKTYEAELGDFNQLGTNTKTAVKTENSISGYSSSGYITGLNTTSVTAGGGVRFNVMVENNGLYNLTLGYCSKAAGNANIYIDNTAKTLNNLVKSTPLLNTDNKWETTVQTVFLQKGINVIDIDTDVETAIDYLRVNEANNVSDKIITVEAETCSTTGKITKVNNSYASNGTYVKGLMAGSKPENQLTVNVTVPSAGHYKMVVYHSNGELFGGHPYNAQLVDRFATIQINDTTPKNIFFRNTYSDESFKTKTVDVNLKAGSNAIKIYNDNSRNVKCGVLNGSTINYQTLINYTPNFDKFEFIAASIEEPAISN